MYLRNGIANRRNIKILAGIWIYFRFTTKQRKGIYAFVQCSLEDFAGCDS